LEQHRASDSGVRRVLGGWVAALTRPRVATFAALVRDASWTGVLFSLLVGGVLAGLVRLGGSGATGQGPVEAFIGGLVSAVVLFCIQAAYLLLATRLLTNPEGQLQQVYALSLFWPLLNVALMMLTAGGAFGWVGALLWLPATLYGLFLSYLTVQAVPGLVAPSARLVVLVPVILLAVLGLLICGLLTLLSGNLSTLENQ
jgi:hypothetical protein